jgi:alpha-galactosidase
MELQHQLASSTSGAAERPFNAVVPAQERHFTIAELSERWFFSKNTIRRLFSQEPGVVKIARPQTRSKRGYTSMRIPERIAERVHRRLQGLS